jgi:hypothetical protein
MPFVPHIYRPLMFQWLTVNVTRSLGHEHVCNVYISGDISLCRFLYKWLLLWIKYSLCHICVLCLKNVNWTRCGRQKVQVYSDLKYTVWELRFWKHWQFGWWSYGLCHCVVWWVVTNMFRPVTTCRLHSVIAQKMTKWIFIPVLTNFPELFPAVLWPAVVLIFVCCRAGILFTAHQ